MSTKQKPADRRRARSGTAGGIDRTTLSQYLGEGRTLSQRPMSRCLRAYLAHRSDRAVDHRPEDDAMIMGHRSRLIDRHSDRWHPHDHPIEKEAPPRADDVSHLTVRV
jgi:hypothetical protein